MSESRARDEFLRCATSGGDVADGALWLAADDFPNLDISPYQELLTLSGASFKDKIGHLSPPDGDGVAYLDAMSQVLEEHCPVRGCGGGDPKPHYLHKVIERKLGVPLLCSVIWIAIAHRAGVEFECIAVPGRFLVRIGTLLVDPSLPGHVIDREELLARLSAPDAERSALQLDSLQSVSVQDILLRMTRNLRGCYAVRQQWKLALRSADRSVLLMPGDPRERRDRGIVRWQAGRIFEALEDLEYYCDHARGAKDIIKIEAIVSQLKSQIN